jgi:hypothetical protein
LKIDVEGHEAQVLHGALQLFLTHRVLAAMVELGSFEVYDSAYLLAAYKAVTAAGYALTTLNCQAGRGDNDVFVTANFSQFVTYARLPLNNRWRCADILITPFDFHLTKASNIANTTTNTTVSTTASATDTATTTTTIEVVPTTLQDYTTDRGVVSKDQLSLGPDVHVIKDGSISSDINSNKRSVIDASGNIGRWYMVIGMCIALTAYLWWKYQTN